MLTHVSFYPSHSALPFTSHQRAMEKYLVYTGKVKEEVTGEVNEEDEGVKQEVKVKRA